MGICGSKQSKPPVISRDEAFEKEMNDSIHDPSKTKRQKMAWHREGVDITEVYDVIEIVGQGSMGEVMVVRKKKHALSKIEERTGSFYRATSSTLSGAGNSNGSVTRKYACKTVNTLRMKDNEIREFVNEVDILRDLDHPNIVQLFEVYKVKRRMWLVIELCSGGDLTARSKNMTEADAAIVLEQILRAVRYMHKRNVCHRDLKLENVMYADKSADSEVKLIDFGLSNRFTKGEKMLKACGTVYTAAPELILGHGYTEQSDIWSIGVMAWILLSKTYPFLRELEEMKDEKKMDALANARYTFGEEWKERKISKYGKEFCTFCLRKHPGSRWSAWDALEYLQQKWIPHLESIEEWTGEEAVSVAELATASSPPAECNAESNMLDAHAHSSGTDEETKSERDTPLNRSVAAKKKRVRMDEDMVNGMGTYVDYGELKKTILMTMAYTMDKSSLGELREIFTVLDTQGAGTVTLVDLKNALKSMETDKQMDDATIEKLFHGIDVDNSGQIHYNEFLAAVVESQGLITMEHLADAFDRLDSDGKGYISKDDLRNLLGSDYNEDLVNAMIDEADFKKNGQVDYDEFLRLMFEDPTSGYKNIGGNLNEDKEMVERLGLIDPAGALKLSSKNLVKELSSDEVGKEKGVEIVVSCDQKDGPEQ